MFFAGGGFPFGNPDAHFARGPRREVDNTKFYQVLGLDKSASVADVKKAYRKLAIRHHPDKGGDSETFKEICRAYEVLSDPEKRKVYDDYGEEGLDNSGATEPTDIFDLFFGGGGGRSRRPHGKRRGEDIESSIKVTLEQIYTSATRRMAISKDVICDSCDGHGGPKEAIENCAMCNGTGVRVQIRQIGPMIQQTQAPCRSCRQGKVIPENRKCHKCAGVGTYKEKKVLEVFVEKGVPDGHRVVFSGEADEKPDTIPGDVRFIIQQQEHSVFQRKGHNLLMVKSITLYEALTGYQFVIQQLDGRKLLVQNAPGEIVEPGSVKAVPSEGMPVYKNPFDKGHLFIEFNVVMPLTRELRLQGAALKQALRKVLPTPIPVSVSEDDADLEHHFVTDVTPEMHHIRGSGRDESGYDDGDGDDEGPEGHKVQCRQQ